MLLEKRDWPAGAILSLILSIGANGVAAQSVTIDLDQLSKVAYCLGVMQTQEQQIFAGRPSFCSGNNGASDATCVEIEKGHQKFKQKINRFRLYILSRTMEFPDTVLAVTAGLDTGRSDMTECSTEMDDKRNVCTQTLVNGDILKNYLDCAEPPEGSPGPCRRIAVCATREVP